MGRLINMVGRCPKKCKLRTGDPLAESTVPQLTFHSETSPIFIKCLMPL